MRKPVPEALELAQLSRRVALIPISGSFVPGIILSLRSQQSIENGHLLFVQYKPVPALSPGRLSTCLILRGSDRPDTDLPNYTQSLLLLAAVARAAVAASAK